MVRYKVVYWDDDEKRSILPKVGRMVQLSQRARRLLRSIMAVIS